MNTTLTELTKPDIANSPTSLEINDLLQKYSSPKEEFFGIFEPRLKAVDVDKLMSSYGNPSNLPTPKENLKKYPEIPRKKENTVTYEKLCAYINQHVHTTTDGRGTKHAYHSLKNKPNVVNSINYAKGVRHRNNIPPQTNTLSYNNAVPTRKESKHMYGELRANIHERDVGGKEHENRNSYNSLKNRPVDTKCFTYAKQAIYLTTFDNNTPSQSNMFNYNSTVPTRKESKHMFGKFGPNFNQHDVEGNERIDTNSFNYPKKIEQHNNTPSQSNMFNYNNTNLSRKESKDIYEKFGACINELNFIQKTRDTTNSFHYPKKLEKYNNNPPKFNMSKCNNKILNRKESNDIYEKFGACINELNLKQNARDTTNSFHYPKKFENYNSPPKFNMFDHGNVKPIKKEYKDTYSNELNYKGNECDSTNFHNSFNNGYDIKNPFKRHKEQEQLTNDPSRFDALDCNNANPMKKESGDKYQELNVFTNQHNNEGKNNLNTTSTISLRNMRFIKNSFKYLKQFEEQNSNLFKSHTPDYTDRDMKNEEPTKIYDQLCTYSNERIVGGKEPHISMLHNSRNDCLYNYLKKIEQLSYQAVSFEMLDYCRRFVAPNIYDRLLIKYNLMKIFSRHSLKN
ncbi:probable serine/threonine-protein kinase clkA isoform X2 [Teleopsis dalmanni]|nr:probable serine/threonine-protein kinase clkA isoform X2 [Teleopsis dalmanni]XP_037939890.1 probable serine/threonine-protein kinase clkA isoform X2 [Teleopsis dalmanni]